MNKFEVGLVIPIYQTKFIKQTVANIIKTTNSQDLIVCIVNDGGKIISDFLSRGNWPNNVIILNLKENKAFASANNAGWKYLIRKFPSIKYIGSINDDTIPRSNWLDYLVDTLNKYPRVGLAMPVMETNLGWFGTKKNYATWAIISPDGTMRPLKNELRSDCFVSTVNGFCFLAFRKALEEVNYFDENYKNGHEDIDLGLSLMSKGWRLVVVQHSSVFHYGGSSRWLSGAVNPKANSEYFLKKWGGKIEKYNNLVIPKISVYCLAFNQDHFIESWVKNASAYADEIIVMYSKYPWNYNPQARNLITPDNTGKILHKLKKKYPNLNIYEGQWKNETDERNEALRLAKKNGSEWLLTVDTDEFYTPEEIFKAYFWMLQNPSEVWKMYHIQLVKKPNWSVITPQGNPCFEFAIDLKHVQKFENKRLPKARIFKTIPENICKNWHFSYVMPFNKIVEKLSSFGHMQEIRPNWLKEIWPRVKPGIKNFHPVDPSGWQRIKVVQPPKVITDSIPWIKNAKDFN
jgi:GT2 family glycosyltransferase